LRLSNRNDLWYTGGGAFQPATFSFVGRPSNGSQSLANLYDVSVDDQINPHTFPSYMLFDVGFAVTHPEFWRWFAAAIAACLIVLGIVAVPLNLRLSRKYQPQIDELDALPKTWNTP
jgi:acyl-CoA synthetase (AMP-forming)/AMP-acid ligase II